MANLVRFQNNLFCPIGARDVTTATALPGAFNYNGRVAIALTDDAFWMVAPTRDHLMIPLANIRRVRVEDFRGLAYIDFVDGEQTVVAPNDTAGVTIEYQTLGNFIHQASFITHLSNKAFDWARRIQQAVASYNLRNYVDPQNLE